MILFDELAVLLIVFRLFGEYVEKVIVMFELHFAFQEKWRNDAIVLGPCRGVQK